MKNLIFISAFLFLLACGKENSDPVAPPPPTVPPRKPAPSPAETAKPKPATPATPENPVIKPAPVTPSPVVPVKTSPAVLDNVVWNCFNPITKRTVQVNGYHTDVGSKFFLRPHGEAPIELKAGDSYGTASSGAPQRFCAKPDGIFDRAAYVLEIRGSFFDARKGAQHLATLTRFRNLSIDISCERKPDGAEYDIKDALTCTLGANAFVNPEKPLAGGVDLQDLGVPEIRSSRHAIRSVKRDTLGNTYILAASKTVIRLDKNAKKDMRFGAGGSLDAALPRETLNDQIEKIIDIAPEAAGGFFALVQMEKSGDVAAVHFSENGQLAKHILVNGFVILKTGYAPNTRFSDGSIIADGLDVFTQFDQEIILVRNGTVSSIKERLNQPFRRIFQSAKTTLGGVLITWTDSNDIARVTHIKSDLSLGFTVSPSPEATATIYSGRLESIPARDGGFYFVFMAVDRYGNRTLKIQRHRIDGSRDNRFDFSFTQPIDYQVGRLNFDNVAKSAFVFGDGSLGLPFVYGGKATETDQLGIFIVSTEGRIVNSLKGSIGQKVGFTAHSHSPWMISDVNGSLHTLGNYQEGDLYSHDRLIMIQVSP